MNLTPDGVDLGVGKGEFYDHKFGFNAGRYVHIYTYTHIHTCTCTCFGLCMVCVMVAS